MADKEYGTVIGFVQFLPRDLTVGGQDVRSVSVRQTGSGRLVSVTIWPEFEHVEINEGDFIAADGSLFENTKDDKVYLNLSAQKLFVNGHLEQPVRQEVVRKSPAKKSSKF